MIVIVHEMRGVVHPICANKVFLLCICEVNPFPFTCFLQAPASLTGLDETTPADAGTPMDFDTTPAVNMDEEINVPESSPLVDHMDSATPGAVDITAEDTSASVPEEAVSPVPPAEASLEVLAGGQGSSPKIL